MSRFVNGLMNANLKELSLKKMYTMFFFTNGLVYLRSASVSVAESYGLKILHKTSSGHFHMV